MNRLRALAMVPALLVVVAAALGPTLAPQPAERAVGIPFADPNGAAWLGTDRLGRDVLSRLLYGGWGLLLLAAVIAVLVTVVASVLGAVAALRPRVGALIETATDFAMLVPVVLGILLVLTSWPDAGIYGLIVVAMLFGVPYCARVFAATAAGVAASGYVEAARASGESLPHLVFREVLPNLREVFAAQLGLRFVEAVYLVSTASFLHLPTTLGSGNWAVMVRDNASGILLNPWAVLAPSLAIAVVAVSVNLAVSEFGRGRQVAAMADMAGVRQGDDLGPAESPVFDEGADVAVGSSTAKRSVVSGGDNGSGGRSRLATAATPPRQGAGPAASSATEMSLSGMASGGIDASVPDDGGDSIDGGSEPDSLVIVDGLLVRGQAGQELVGPVSFRMRPGTVTALTGPSGSGKTTLMRALLGHLPTGAVLAAGTVRVAEQAVFALDPAELRRFRRTRITYVGQDPGSALNPLMRVRTLLAEVARDRSESALLEALAAVGLAAEHLRRRPGELSGGQQRRVALARALVRRTDVLVLDEPLAGLHGSLRTEIAELLSELAKRGTTILLSGHDTATIRTIADQVIEVGTQSPPHPATAPDTDAKGAAEPTALGLPAHPATNPEARIALRASGISATSGEHRVLADIDLALTAGSALAVVGASGAGKTTLARVIAGLRAAEGGSLLLADNPIEIGGKRRIGRGGDGIQLVPQNPMSALNPRRTVAQTLGRPLRRIARVRKSAAPQRITELLDAVELPAALAARYPHELSGGQRQRVALARALAAEPSVLICDEITSALDHATAASIMALLDRIRGDRGTALLVITHDMNLVAGHCTELVVLDQGRIVESGRTAEVLANPVEQATHDLLV
ncbi:ATP-binding cassette domain-containing protein [Nocardia bhagyanarayanae]|uniref:ABC-type glutathione transport system ATPase component n=1 Tax=Nocardia bhagyanarayanae TaxID=1215925 RepID=A0A543F9T9_9NOCA|nr:ATP-binding cassette domain-containing protein [Nocardia bhagyanarayanae]TQM30585.1 ABC-type glutathione transport system ATPase component [Nocardia bhagyanarayanae]